MYNVFQIKCFFFFCETRYYRVNYDSEILNKIIYYLNSESRKYRNISVINRAKIIDDAFHLTMALNVFLFWELTKYLSQETDCMGQM